jgi:shikimate kinase
VVKSTKEELEALYNSRRDVYLAHSTLKLECIGSPVENAEKIAELLRK